MSDKEDEARRVQRLRREQLFVTPETQLKWALAELPRAEREDLYDTLPPNQDSTAPSDASALPGASALPVASASAEGSPKGSATPPGPVVVAGVSTSEAAASGAAASGASARAGRASPNSPASADTLPAPQRTIPIGSLDDAATRGSRSDAVVEPAQHPPRGQPDSPAKPAVMVSDSASVPPPGAAEGRRVAAETKTPAGFAQGGEPPEPHVIRVPSVPAGAGAAAAAAPTELQSAAVRPRPPDADERPEPCQAGGRKPGHAGVAGATSTPRERDAEATVEGDPRRDTTVMTRRAQRRRDRRRGLLALGAALAILVVGLWITARQPPEAGLAKPQLESNRPELAPRQPALVSPRHSIEARLAADEPAEPPTAADSGPATPVAASPAEVEPAVPGRSVEAPASAREVEAAAPGPAVQPATVSGREPPGAKSVPLPEAPATIRWPASNAPASRATPKTPAKPKSDASDRSWIHLK